MISRVTQSNQSPVTVLGLGPMGKALARAFLDNGHSTTVWNRSPGKADGLGARRADTVAEAVAASPLVIICVLDYTAARAILEPAAEALRGRTVVNLTADTPQRARDMAQWAAAHGIDYLDGAIMTVATAMGGPQTLVLYSGPEDVYGAHRDTLSALRGTAEYLGAEPGRSAAHDVALLDIFWTAMSGLVHAFAMAGAENIAAADFARLARPVADLSDFVAEFAQAITDDHFPGDVSNLVSASAGMTHIIEAARAHGIDTSVLAAARSVARRAIDAGHGGDDFARLAQVLAKEAA